MTLDSSLRFRAATGGTYYFSVESFGPAGWDPEDDGPGQGTTSGTYSLHVSIGPPATAAQIAQENVEALISGAEWPSPNLTYAFPNEANDYPGNFGDGEPNTFEPFTALPDASMTVVSVEMRSAPRRHASIWPMDLPWFDSPPRNTTVRSR